MDMQVKRYRSKLTGMYTWRIEHQGRSYAIVKDYKGRYLADIPSGQPGVTAATITPFTGRSPEVEHEAIKKLLTKRKETP